MAEFRILAEKITAAIISMELGASGDDGFSAPKSGVIRVGDLPGIIEKCAGICRQEFNLYPGIPGDRCHGLAVFVALASPSLVKGRRGHLSCGMAIEEIVRHMDADCRGKTEHALFLTDHWDTAAAEKWKTFLLRIKQQRHLEIYLIDRLTGANLALL